MWSGNHLGHRSQIRDNCFITSHVVISGYCVIGENSFLGVNSAFADQVIVAEDNFIAMGAIVTKSTETNKVYKGTPAKASAISAKEFCKLQE